jgi:ABC-type multidrug transport system ATPase subunit
MCPTHPQHLTTPCIPRRRQVWDLISEVKRERVVVLTTHSMEEADVLGDRIGIIAAGQLRCLGTSLVSRIEKGGRTRV